MMKYLKKGDRVKVIAGNDKGRTGEVLVKRGSRILVKGVNIRKRHRKGGQNTKPTIIETESFIHLSNVAFCPVGEDCVKLRFRLHEEKKQVYYFDKRKKLVEHRTLTK